VFYTVQRPESNTWSP